MRTFERLQSDELSKVRARGLSCKSWHEAYGLILEELDEFWEEVRKKTSKRDRMGALKELVQISALCQRAAEDLALVDDYEKTRMAV
jgi:hypothetical protein